MAKEAERLLDGSGWLPEPLRLAEQDTETALPSFLADDDPSLCAAVKALLLFGWPNIGAAGGKIFYDRKATNFRSS